MMKKYTILNDIYGNETITIFIKDDIVVCKRLVAINENRKIEYWCDKTNRLHRADGPAKILYEDNKITKQYCYKRGKIHSNGDQPAIIVYENGKIIDKHWYKYGKLHRDGDRPAMIYHKDGQIDLCWYKDDKWHRDGDKPAVIHCKNNGRVVDLRWYKDDKWHRDGDKPATIYYKDGEIIEQSWCKDDNNYREVGPCRIMSAGNNKIVNYWINDKRRIRYMDVPEEKRLPQELRRVIKVLPLPIGDEILLQCEWIWPFVDIQSQDILTWQPTN